MINWLKHSPQIPTMKFVAPSTMLRGIAVTDPLGQMMSFAGRMVQGQLFLKTEPMNCSRPAMAILQKAFALLLLCSLPLRILSH